MTTQKTRNIKTGWSFIIRWGLLTAASIIIGTIVSLLLASSINNQFNNLIMQAVYSLFGTNIDAVASKIISVTIFSGMRSFFIALSVGFTQWLLLRNYIQGAIGWFFAILIGKILGSVIVSDFIIYYMNNVQMVYPDLHVILIVSPIIGFLIALAQGGILRHNGYQRKQWLFVVPVVWAITYFFDPEKSLSFVIPPSPFLSSYGVISLWASGLVSLVVVGLFQGILEGSVLSWVFKHHDPSS